MCIRDSSRTIVHVDAVQAWMRVPIKLDNIDTMAVSGHKIHAPKGVGALYLSDRLVQAFQPPYLGGEQERGLRPGTENLPYALGLAAAATRLADVYKRQVWTTVSSRPATSSSYTASPSIS